ncbi:hypothetical protein [Streptomyces chartreusis]|uniref:hypothetical protein n=1 Tax=Streptomyces chartreusis TaxID=1969 RepID=UPI0033B8F959
MPQESARRHGRLDVPHSNALAQLGKPAHELHEAEWGGPDIRVNMVLPGPSS